jgi:radical SAM superfamily enzyme YgiQ (UPF0313 family)
MQSAPVVFVAFLEQDNLGIGYLASLLLSHKIDVKIIDFRVERERILQQLRHYDPLVVGFSVIFQYHIYDFKDLVHWLRCQGIDCHFCAGGHYPSLRYAELLETIPELDSVVLFEGEHTFLELVETLRADQPWQDVSGIAYRNGDKLHANPLRALEPDLDRFPPPVRQPLREYALGKKYATLLAGRGCYYNCSFCSIRAFYSRPPGPVKRTRRPEMVVREMELLYEQQDCSLFMFQDDDFPVIGDRGRAWTTRFCELLVQKGLAPQVMWKINCRTDEVRSDLFEVMREAGLFLVYLGIEDGTKLGLELMNKRITPETNLSAVRTLGKLGIEYDYGFMLFQPESTFDSVLENLDFLEKLCGDGSSPITFCKMLPYAGTQVEQRLKEQGRLIGKAGFADYRFYDVALDRLYATMMDSYRDWVADHDGVLNLARWARSYTSVLRKYYPDTAALRDVERAMRNTLSQSNCFFIQSARELTDLFRLEGSPSPAELERKKAAIERTHGGYKAQLEAVMAIVTDLAPLPIRAQ